MLYENNTYDQERALYGVQDAVVKNCRFCEKVVLKNTTVNSPEFIWKVRGLEIDNVEILGSEYPFFEVRDAKIKNLKMKGKYSNSVKNPLKGQIKADKIWEVILDETFNFKTECKIIC